MIAFNIKDEIVLEKWADIINRSSFKAPIDFKKYQDAHIKAIYAFSEENARCGESNCLQPHHQGFLISISSKQESNLCESCGQLHLGVSFEQQKQRFKDQATEREQRIQLNTALEQKEAIKSRAKELKRVLYGANWLYQSLKSFRQTYPGELLSALKTLMVNKEDNNKYRGLTWPFFFWGNLSTEASQELNHGGNDANTNNHYRT